MEEPTTDPAAVETGALEAQPAEPAAPQSAASTPPEPTTTPTDEPDAPAPEDDTAAWLKSKGIEDPNSPEAILKVAEMARNAEKRMHETTMKASELQKALATEPAQDSTDLIDEDDRVSQLQQQVDALTRARQVEEFFSAGGDPEKAAERKALEPAMAKIVTDNPTIGALVNGGYLSYDQLLAMAKGSDSDLIEKAKVDGGREALAKVASNQQARAVPGAATTSALDAGTVTKENFDSWYAGLSAAERAKPENQAIVARVLS